MIIEAAHCWWCHHGVHTRKMWCVGEQFRFVSCNSNTLNVSAHVYGTFSISITRNDVLFFRFFAFAPGLPHTIHREKTMKCVRIIKRWVIGERVDKNGVVFCVIKRLVVQNHRKCFALLNWITERTCDSSNGENEDAKNKRDRLSLSPSC